LSADDHRPPREFLRALHGEQGGHERVHATSATTSARGAPAPTPTPTPPASPPPFRHKPGIAGTAPGPVQHLVAFVNQPVVFHLRYGEALRGLLVRMYAYELVLKLADGREAVVMKHAVDWIEPGGGRSRP
jgi:sRNA-binding regulator protein Hfq